MFRALVRRASSTAVAKAPPQPASKAPPREKVPDCMVSFGVQDQKLTFISHPGVMAIARLTELGPIVMWRGHLTQEHVDAFAEFDDELARKAQIAVDHDLPVNMIELEYIERPGYLDRLLKDKAQLEEIRREVMAMPPGDYSQPKSVEGYKRPDIGIEQRGWPPPMEGMHLFDGKLTSGTPLPEERERLMREGFLPSDKPEHKEYQRQKAKAGKGPSITVKMDLASRRPIIESIEAQPKQLPKQAEFIPEPQKKLEDAKAKPTQPEQTEAKGKKEPPAAGAGAKPAEGKKA
mmetsp:Transcript_4782/g.11074  ORF Transcript_4782/g.11074 Transcript_4782/m.11074 type:complete len:291 (+) Transcript_4782:165-1037(+)